MGNIFGQLFGDKSTSDLDKTIDSLITIIPPKKEDDPPHEIAGDVIQNFFKKSNQIDEISQLFEGAAVPQSRLNRYMIYDEIKRSVPIISKILKTYTSNVLPKNPADGQTIIYRESSIKNDVDTKRNEFSKKFVKKIFKDFDLATNLKKIVILRQFLYGDCFIEVVDSDVEFEKLNKNDSISFLSECKKLNDVISNTSHNNINANSSYIFESLSNLLIDIEVPSQKKTDNIADKKENSDNELIADIEYDDVNKDKSEKVLNFDNILFKYHKPHNIIILNTDYGTCLGYLEVRDNTIYQSSNSSMSLANVVGKITSMTKNMDMSESDIVNNLVLYTLKKCISKITDKNNKRSVDDILKSLDPQVFTFFKRMFVEQGFLDKQKSITTAKVRYIPTNRMVQFNTPSVDYEPYGQSIIDDLILPGKLYMLAQLSNAVTKLSRASVIRKWTLDVGSSNMHAGMIQKLKRELFNTRVTIDDLNSFKSIPKILSDFKDMFVISQNGKTPVDVDVQSMGDPSIKVQDLEDARREIIALSGVPAPYIGYNDVVELREQLVHSNVAFATEIIDSQENISKSLNLLIDIVADIKKLGYSPTKYVTVSLIPPVVLVLQLIESTLASIGNIASIFQQMNIPLDPYHFLRQYVPHIDWDDFKKAALKHQLDSTTKKNMNTGGGGDTSQSGGW